MRKIALLCLALILSTSPLSAYQAQVENISSQKYFESTLKEITEAKASVVVAMYLVSALPGDSDSQPNRLLNALIQAKDRGVKVKVILDQNINFEAESTEAAATSNKNQLAYEILKKNNVPVFYDTSEIYTHSKAIIIDGETVIVGSTNWSKAALTRNNEASVIIRSKELAQDFLNDINKIQIQENIPASLTPSVSVPKDFLSNKKLLGEMVSQSDERAFDMYLYLLKEFDQNKESKLTLDYDNLAKSLKIEKMPVEDYRRQIRKILDKLKDKYKLIDFNPPQRNQNAEIRLKLNSEAETFHIPTTYWRFNWHNLLSFPAKAMYFINLSYTQASPDSRFSISREKLSQNHGISESFISQGNQELRALNLLHIEYGDLEDLKFSSRRANVYQLEELYDIEEFNSKVHGLRKKHGDEKYDRAAKAAKAVFEEYNLETIKTLIDLEDKYGQATVGEAVKKVSEKNPDNPKRSAGYLINTIKSMGQKGQA